MFGAQADTLNMWAALRWVKTRASRGSGPYHLDAGLGIEDVPPGVLEARRQMGLQAIDRPGHNEEDIVVVDEVAGDRPEASGSGTPAPGTPGVRGRIVRAESGQERFRVRGEGPWVADPRSSRNLRGSAHLAEEIASSNERVNSALVI